MYIDTQASCAKCQLAAGVGSVPRILNTGSGPLAPRPLQCEGKEVKVVAADGLARFYLKVPFSVLALDSNCGHMAPVTFPRSTRVNVIEHVLRSGLHCLMSNVFEPSAPSSIGEKRKTLPKLVKTEPYLEILFLKFTEKV